MKYIIIIASVIFVILVFFFIKLIIRKKRVKLILNALLPEKTDNVKRVNFEAISNLPEITKKYIKSNLRENAKQVKVIKIKMSGWINLNGKKMDLRAEQILNPSKGFVWKAKVKSGLMRISGHDYYYNNKAQMNFNLFGLFCVVNESNENIVRSAKGRAIIESIWLANTLLSETCKNIKETKENALIVTLGLDGEISDIKLNVSDEGKIKSGVMKRWGNENQDNEFRYMDFGFKVHETKEIQGYTIPVKMEAGWNFGTENYRPFIYFEFEKVELL